ncbi:MAG: hypothetical protein ACR2GY_07175 [Phycisphaerales bacterium]
MRLPDRYEINRFVEHHRTLLVRLGIIGGILAIALLLGTWWFSRWQPPPSIFDSPIDNAIAYFTTDDFNQLPVDERMELIAQFIDRFRTLSQSESAVLASFMAGVSGRTREQLEENIRVLARDLMKDGADEYFQTPPDQRAAYLDEWVLKWMKFGERVERGEERDISDEKRLTDARSQGQRDTERMERDANDTRLKERDAVRIMDMWRREIEAVATPKEQGQIMKFMDDLRQHFTQ